MAPAGGLRVCVYGLAIGPIRCTSRGVPRFSYVCAGSMLTLSRKTLSGSEAAVQEAGGRAQDTAAMRAQFDRELRQQLQDVSIRRLCDATGLSPSYWSLIRRGMRVPHVRHWEALKALGKCMDA